MTTVEAREVRMTRGGEVIWQMHEVASRAGVLLLSPECSDAAAAALLAHPEELPVNERLGSGSNATTYSLAKDPEVALKVHGNDLDGLSLYAGTLADLQANVATHYGLERVSQPNPAWTMRAPQMFGAFLSHEAMRNVADDDAPASVYAMERVRPLADAEDIKPSLQASPYLRDFPSLAERSDLIEQVGARFNWVPTYHDSDEGCYNLMIEKLPSKHDRGIIVAYDNTISAFAPEVPVHL